MSADGDDRFESSNEIDFALLVAGLRNLKRGARPEDVSRVETAIKFLGSTPLPDSYLQGIRSELLEMLGLSHVDQTFVYVTFWGVEGHAEFMKIGVARNVAARMATIRTGNPLALLRVYKGLFKTRSEAMRIEAALLEHCKTDRVTGEWVRCKASLAVCDEIAKSLFEVAREACGRHIEFHED